MLFATLCYTFDVTLFTTLFNRTFLHFCTLSLYTFCTICVHFWCYLFTTLYYTFCTLFHYAFLLHFCYTFLLHFATHLYAFLLHFLLHFATTLCNNFLLCFATLLVRFLLHLSLHFWYYIYLLHFALPVALAYTFSTLFSTLCTTILYICTPQICIHFALPFNILCHINRPCNSLSQDGTVCAICTGLWPLCKNYCFTDALHSEKDKEA